ncbi:MAG: nuclear transport factor 2 family protein [Ignavibacteria bacterium]|nr:nuclear transport factor 2 family protein [Ignavibacteria bacterium]
MKNIISCFVLTLSVCFLPLNTLAFAKAQDAAQVRAAIESHYTPIHSQNREEIFQQHLPDFTLCISDGRPLIKAGTIEAAARMGANLDFGTANMYMSHFNTQIYGDVVVATFYLVGTHTWGGETKNRTWRVTAVWA